MSRNTFLLVSSGLVGALASFAAHAQTLGDPVDGTAEARTTGLQEIVVTAQKRSENLQDVPIAITASSGEDLAAKGITDTLQLTTIAPGLNIRTTAGAFQPSIRGIGTSSNIVENPVALYIDNVYYPQQREGMRQLDDIAQVAILKGPQGTLFGRNATGGVIQITTLDPSYDFGGKVRGEIDNYATIRGSVYATGGLSDTVAGSISVSYAKQGEGWGDNLTTGNDTFKILHDFSARAKLMIEPSSRTKITLIGDYQDKNALANSFQPYQGLPLRVPGTGPLDSVYDSYAGVDSVNGFKGGGLSMTINEDLGFADLVSITAYRKGVGSYRFDNTAVPEPFFVVDSPRSPSKSFTQELQLISPKNEAISWVVGMYYFHYSNGSDPILRNFAGIFAPNPDSVFQTETTAREVTESIAPFGEVTWEFLPDTHLTAGARYTYEKRRLEDGQVIAYRGDGTSATTLFPKDPLTVKEPTYRIALDRQFTPDLMGYASFNTGIKSGGFNIVTPANNAYLPEKLKAYEVGLKSELFDRSARLNVAAFYYDYSNLQVIQFVGLTQAVVNGPSAEIYGIDVDFEAELTPDFRASGGFEWKHAEFTDYNGAAFSTPVPTGGATIFPGDATGNRLPLAQEFSGTLALDYHVDLSAGMLDFNVTGNYNGDYYFEADNFLRQDDYVILNASVKWTDPSETFDFTIWGKNLLNEKVITQVTSQSIGYPATYGNAPLTFGATAVARF